MSDPPDKSTGETSELPKLTRIAIKVAYPKGPEALEYEGCLEKTYQERVSRHGSKKARKWLAFETLCLFGPGAYRAAKVAFLAYLFGRS